MDKKISGYAVSAWVAYRKEISTMNEELELLRDKKGFICDMDGVIYHGNRLLPGVKEFVDWLYKEEKEYFYCKALL